MSLANTNPFEAKRLTATMGGELPATLSPRACMIGRAWEHPPQRLFNLVSERTTRLEIYSFLQPRPAASELGLRHAQQKVYLAQGTKVRMQVMHGTGYQSPLVLREHALLGERATMGCGFHLPPVYGRLAFRQHRYSHNSRF